MTDTNKANPTAGNTALFIDYDDLHRNLVRLTRNEDASRIIEEMIDTLLDNLSAEEGAIAETRAYVDFASLRAGDQAKNMLYMKGVETRDAPSANRESAIELQIGVDAMDLLHKRPDVARLALLSGQRLYLPLVQAFKKNKRSILVASFAERNDDWFLPARTLLSASGQQFMPAPSASPAARSAPPAAERRTRIAPPPPPVERRPRIAPPSGPFEELEDPILIRTLEIIDDHFGQYPEVYLTPLLRKLSDLVDERRYDPKNLISNLEEQQAVRLEKRSGFPHDYTVLILDERHPTVDRILSGKQRSAGRPDPFRASHSPWYRDDDVSDNDEEEDDVRLAGAEDEAEGDYDEDEFDYDEYDRDLDASA